MVSEETNKAIDLSFLEDFFGRSSNDRDLFFQSGDAVCGKSVELDQHGLNGSVVCVSERCAEMLSDVLGESLRLRDMGEELFLERIDNWNRCHFGEKFRGVSVVAVDLSSSFCCSSGHCR